jgi:hypothetical protein
MSIAALMMIALLALLFGVTVVLGFMADPEHKASGQGLSGDDKARRIKLRPADQHEAWSRSGGWVRSLTTSWWVSSHQ